jgi:putative nucleotidyltransferase with HDIG domain
MRIRVGSYVAVTAAAAIAAGVVVYLRDPSIPPESLAAIGLMAVLALVAEALAISQPLSSTGSIAFIPYFATVLVAPNWLALLVVATIRALADVMAKRDRVKTVFNAAQHALVLAVAILISQQLGGTSLLNLRSTTLVEATAATGAAALAGFGLAYLISGLLVSGVISIAKGMPMGQVWRTNQLATLWLDLLSLPLIFVFAWVYARFGTLAAATCWVPILGLRQVHKINLELERTNEELLELMVKSMEARDPYTSGHSRRVQHFSTLIARAIGLSEREVSLTGRAALLHDVGKIYEKYGPILAKSERLSPEEWAIIQAHPIDGANLVSTMSRLRDVVGPIRHHHENWDGTGYPDGLAGELIPLSSRIIRFADTIDAMTTDRPYRSGLSQDQVRSELVRCRARQFDPVITDKLLSSSQWAQLFDAGDATGWDRPALVLLEPERAAG